MCTRCPTVLGIIFLATILLLFLVVLTGASKIISFDHAYNALRAPECMPQQCIEAQTALTWETIDTCRRSGAEDCIYVASVDYDDEALPDLITRPWEDGLIFEGSLPEEISSFDHAEGSGDLSLHLRFDPKQSSTSSSSKSDPGDYTAALRDSRRCLYMVSNTSLNSPPPTRDVYKPDYSCELHGLPLGYNLNDNEQVGFILVNSSLENDLWTELQSYFLCGGQLSLHHVIQPIEEYESLTKVAIDGLVDYIVPSLASDTTWKEEPVILVDARLTSETGEIHTCALSLSHDYQSEAESIDRCLSEVTSNASDFYDKGTIHIESMPQTPQIQCIIDDDNHENQNHENPPQIIKTSIHGTNLLGDFISLQAESIQVKMHAAAYQDCLITLPLQSSTERSPWPLKCTGEGDTGSLVTLDGSSNSLRPFRSEPTSSITTLLSAGSREFTLANLSVTIPYLEMNFSTSLQRCGVSVKQIWVKNVDIQISLRDVKLGKDTASTDQIYSSIWLAIILISELL